MASTSTPLWTRTVALPPVSVTKSPVFRATEAPEGSVSIRTPLFAVTERMRFASTLALRCAARIAVTAAETAVCTCSSDQAER